MRRASTVTAVIRAVFFDYGGVLTTSPFDAFASLEERSGLPRGFIRSVNATNPDHNAWARLERNEIDLATFVELFGEEARAAGHHVNGAEVLACLVGELRPRMIDLVHRCRARYVTGLLTNNFVGLDSSRAGGSSVRDLFDVVVESSAVGVRKPDVRFYEIACAEARVEPGEVVFLDDLGVNLKPARAMGMTTIKVGDPDEAIRSVESLVEL